jgi:hypothetical protein
MRSMAGSSAAMRDGAKARATRPRRRVWSGGSTASMCRANAGPGRPSSTTSGSASIAASMSLERRGSLSAWRAASWPTTSQASGPSPPPSRTWWTGQRSLVAAKCG